MRFGALRCRPNVFPNRTKNFTPVLQPLAIIIVRNLPTFLAKRVWKLKHFCHLVQFVFLQMTKSRTRKEILTRKFNSHRYFHYGILLKCSIKSLPDCLGKEGCAEEH